MSIRLGWRFWANVELIREPLTEKNILIDFELILSDWQPIEGILILAGGYFLASPVVGNRTRLPYSPAPKHGPPHPLPSNRGC